MSKVGHTGRWIDSGFIHMNKELGDVLKKKDLPLTIKIYHNCIMSSITD